MGTKYKVNLNIYLIVFAIYDLTLGEEKFENSSTVDENGYIAFCPCMGRFGNQADQFLGALGFAKGLNRTLILPPWVEYRPKKTHSVQVPFDTYFKVEPVRSFHKVIEMEKFMSDIAPTIWPPEARISFCYMARNNASDCQAKNGNPFWSFWNTFEVDFVSSELYGQYSLNFDVFSTKKGQDMSEKWRKHYPASQWPVLAFVGAPSRFPVAKENVVLHKYIKWSSSMEGKAKSEINKFANGPFVGIHLRNGIDWERACQLVNRSRSLFASSQCLGYRGEGGNLTSELCLPTKEIIVKQLKRVIKSIGAKTIFVASDHDHMISFLTKALVKMQILVVKLSEQNPHLDLAILGRSNHFIGNCVSSFSAFVKRERDAMGFPSSFWAYPLEKKKSSTPRHIEL